MIDWVPPRPDLVEALMFVFDGGVLDPAISSYIRINADELSAWSWCTPEEATAAMDEAPMLSRRVFAACRAKQSHAMCYLESGWHL